MIKTHVTWQLQTPTEQQLVEIREKAVIMIAEGKTDSTAISIDDPNHPFLRIIEKHWVNVDAANEWIAFVQQFNPVSAVIVE